MIIPTAEPFYFPGKQGQPACLLIHGFTGAPKEMRWMGEYLNHEHGFHSLGVRLAGHATHPEDMVRSHHTDWMASVEDGYHLLRDALPVGHRDGVSLSKGGVSDRIYLVGLSMGGVLSLLMSTKLDVAGVVAMSTPYRFPYNYPLWMVRLISMFVRFRPKSGEDWFDQAAYAEHVSYPENPVRSGAEFYSLVTKMQAALPNLSVPVLLVHSKNDASVSPESMEHIFAALGTSDKTKLYITGAGHVVTRDAAKEQVFEAAANFIHRIESTS